MKKTELAAALFILVVGLLAAYRFAPARPVSTRELWMRREAWLDRRVKIVGLLEVFSPGRPGEHYAVEEDGFRVGILGAEPRALSALVGRRVAAEGRFGFSDKFGVYIRIDELERAPAGPLSPSAAD